MVEHGAVGEDKRAVRTQMRAIGSRSGRRRRPSGARRRSAGRLVDCIGERMPGTSSSTTRRRASRISHRSSRGAPTTTSRSIDPWSTATPSSSFPATSTRHSSTSSSFRAWHSPVRANASGRVADTSTASSPTSGATVCASAWRSEQLVEGLRRRRHRRRSRHDRLTQPSGGGKPGIGANVPNVLHSARPSTGMGP